MTGATSLRPPPRAPTATRCRSRTATPPRRSASSQRCRRPRHEVSMNVALTGATGFVGSHVLTALRDHGHHVTALVRDETRADTVAGRGATPVVVDLRDRAAGAAPVWGGDAPDPTAHPRPPTHAHPG